VAGGPLTFGEEGLKGLASRGDDPPEGVFSPYAIRHNLKATERTQPESNREEGQRKPVIDQTLAPYQRFHDETGNSIAASNLTLAHAMLAQQRVQHEIALTVAEAADRLKVSTKKVYQMVQAGEIPHNRVGDQIRIPP
jgi:excisionase family DNA binding protein